MENKKINLKKAMILITFALVGYWIVGNIQIVGNIFKFIFDILFPFVLGGCLAFILNIPMSFFEKKMKKIKNKKIIRVLSLVLAVIVILFVLVLVITLIVPELINVVNLLIDNIPYYTEQINKFISSLEIDIPDINNINIDTETLKEQIISQIPNLVTFSISFVTNVVGAISTFFVAIIFAFYILIDKERLQRQITKLLNAYLDKKKADKIINIGNITNNVFRKFFTVQCLEATILGGLCIIGMLILRLPYAVPIGVLIGVTALIPVVGAFIGIGVGAILIVCVDPMKAVIFVIFVLILQQIEGNFIYPRVVGKSVGLPEMWVLAAVTIGGSVGGILGMLLGVPIATTIYVLLKIDTNKKINMKNKRKVIYDTEE